MAPPLSKTSTQSVSKHHHPNLLVGFGHRVHNFDQILADVLENFLNALVRDIWAILTVRFPPEETLTFVSEPYLHFLGQDMCETY